MDTSKPFNIKEFFVKNKLILTLFSIIFFFLVVIFILLINSSKDKKSGSDNTQSVVPENQNIETNQEKVLILEDNICPDSLEFGTVSFAYIGNQKYGFNDSQKIWIEANCPNTKSNTKTNDSSSTNNSLLWMYNGTSWVTTGNVPECNDPLKIISPVDISLVSGMLYPGQYRGTDYKPHGGFAFDNQSNNLVNLTLPDDAVMWRATRYMESGEIQYLLDFITPCGIAYRFDHILTPSDKVMEVMNTLPEPTENTFTSFLNPVIQFKKGDLLAIELGHTNPLNVGVDFGVYDLRQQNSVSLNNSEWADLHKDESELAFYAICWLDHLEGEDKITARALKARGAYGDEGKESDYCD